VDVTFEKSQQRLEAAAALILPRWSVAKTIFQRKKAKR